MKILTIFLALWVYFTTTFASTFYNQVCARDGLDCMTGGTRGSAHAVVICSKNGTHYETVDICGAKEICVYKPKPHCTPKNATSRYAHPRRALPIAMDEAGRSKTAATKGDNSDDEA